MQKDAESVFFYGLLGIGIFLAGLGFFSNHIIFWDGAMYVGMGKFFFSLGEIGLFEVLRPPLFALILGSFWKIGLDPVFTGKLLVFFCYLGSLVLTYLLALKLFTLQSARIATLFTAFSATIVFYSTKVLGDIVAMFFVLSFFYLLFSKRYFFAGVLCALAFLTRFPNALLLVLAGIYLFVLFVRKSGIFTSFLKCFDSKKCVKEFFATLKNGCFVFVGFALVTIPYFLLLFLNYDDPFFSLKKANAIISLVGTAIAEGPFYYAFMLALENVFILFFFITLYILWKQRILYTAEHCTLLLFIVLFFFYFSFLARKEVRYLLVFLPIIYIYTAFGLTRIFSFLPWRKAIYLSVLLMIVLSQPLAIHLESSFERDLSDSVKEFYAFPVNGTVVTSSPVLMAYQDISPIIIYWIGPDRFWYFQKHRPDAYVVNTCELFCAKNDQDCLHDTEQFILDLKKHLRTSFTYTQKMCTYYVFTRP